MNLSVHQTIQDFDSESWNKLVPNNFPFAKYEFLEALEISDSVGQRTGWHPFFLAAKKESVLIGAMILYLKTNSYGEYIFDWAWADAWKKCGMDYYPKLTSSIPFTPATGPKILTTEIENPQEVTHSLLEKSIELQKELSASSTHILFSTPKENEAALELDFDLRHTFQFHWHNQGYESFESFLANLKQKKRQKIRRERKEIALNSLLEIIEITGEEVKKYSEAFYELYLSTIDKKWSYDYLTKDFFVRIFKEMPDNILIYLAYKDSELIAGTLNFIGGEKIFGRYWGAFEEVQHLHFELCYYRPIEYAIKNKLTIFEAGAQGEHKIQRGLIPQKTYSLHHLPQNRITDLIRRSMEQEQRQADRLIKQGPSMIYK